MAIPFRNPILNMLPDGGIYDPISGLSFTGAPPVISPQPVNEFMESTPGVTIDGYDINSPSVAPAPAATVPTVATGPKTITGVSTTRDASGNLIQTITYSDNSTEDTTIEGPISPPPINNTTNDSSVDDPKLEKRQSAFEVLKERFTVMGLGSLALEIEKIFKGEGTTKAGSAIPIPTSESGFYLALIETDAYYNRFGKVNEDRVKAGYTALDERTILGMEDEYQKVMKSYGTPTGFYDKPEDFQKFLANDLSEVEVADRLQASRQFTSVIDPGIKMQLKSLYNIDDNMLTAYIADPERGQSLLTGLANKSLTGAAAILQGLTANAAAVAEGFGGGELRFQEQQQRFGQAATIAERGTFLSQIERAEKEFGEKEAVEISFGGLEQSVRAAEKLASRERARFGGRAGTTAGSLSTPTAGRI